MLFLELHTHSTQVQRLPKPCASQAGELKQLLQQLELTEHFKLEGTCKDQIWLTSSGTAAQSQHAALLEQQLKG